MVVPVMNYVLMPIFLIIITIIYYILGRHFMEMFHVQKHQYAFRILTGFLTVFFIGFIIGFPMQLLSLSWIFFAIVYALVLILCLVFTIRHYHMTFDKSKLSKKTLKCHFKKYWFVYLLTCLFTLLSVTNTQPYYLNNYNDDYYIAKVVHLIQTPHLLNQNYFYGNVLSTSGHLANALAQGHRMFNTYELVYSALCSYVHISPAFFCRFVMVIHNYYLTFLLYTMFAGLFLKESVAQYALILFACLMIPAGYASRGSLPIKIRMYENWRFQTAIFYGGSVTRVFSIPLFLYFGSFLLKKISKVHLLTYLFVMIALLSFQTNALSYFIIVSLVLIVAKIECMILAKTETKKKKIYYTIILFSLVFVTIITSNTVLASIDRIRKSVASNARTYELYYANAFIFDFFALTGFASITIMMYLDYHRTRLITFALLIIYLIFRLDTNSYFLTLLSFNSYGGARILTSLLMMCMLYCGMIVVKLITHKGGARHLCALLSCVIALATVTGIYMNNDTLKKYNRVEDNMTSIGYSLKPIMANQYMLPTPIAETGKYFNNLKYGQYRLMSEYYIPYEKTTIDSHCLLYSSNRIELYYFLSKQNTESMAYYLAGKKNYNDILGILKVSKCNYILTTRKAVKNDLKSHGWVTKVQGENYWLMYKDTSKIQIDKKFVY